MKLLFAELFIKTIWMNEKQYKFKTIWFHQVEDTHALNSLKITFKEGNRDPDIHCQHYVCWWLGDVRIHDISRHDIDLIYLENGRAWEVLTHWGWLMHICLSNLTIIGSDKGLSLGRHQAIIWTNAGILSIGPLGTNFSEISIKIYTFSFKVMYFKLSAKWQPFCLSLTMLKCLLCIHHERRTCPSS